jgi:tetratricopeptide (TPR) repeat protein
LSEENKTEYERIRKSVVRSFDRYAQRHLASYLAKLKAASPNEKELLTRDYYKVDSLLSKRVFIPGFYVYVLEKVLEDKKLMRQRRTFIKASLISIFNQKGFRIRDVTEKPQQPLESKEIEAPYSRRHTQRFFGSEWTDAFFKQIDDRFTPFSSVFDSSALPSTETSEIARRLTILSNLDTISKPHLLAWSASNLMLEFVMPVILEDMRSFRKECMSVMAEEKKRLPKAYSRFLASDLSYFSPLFETFYKHVSSIFAWKWLEQQTPQYRQRMLDEGFPLDYSEADAAKAKEILLSLTSVRDARSFLFMGAAEFVKRARARASEGLKDATSMARAAVALYNEYLGLGDLSSLDQAIVFENVAVAYRGAGNHKLMVINMKKALELYEKSGDTYRICVALKNLGEGEYYLGFKERAAKYFEESEKLSTKLDSVKMSDVLWNLASAFRRVGDPKTERSYLEKSLAILPISEVERSVQVENRLLELTKSVVES